MCNSITRADSPAFDYLVFIGRFQPYHNGHQAVVQEGLKKAEQLIILCGSAHQPRTTRNPWTSSERERMIRRTLSEIDNHRVHIAPLMDTVYNDELWVRNVQTTVTGIVTAHHRQLHRPAKIGLIGHNKDESAYYLSLFPQWHGVGVDNYSGIDATKIRHTLLTQEDNSIENDVPAPVFDWLNEFKNSSDFQEIQSEFEYIQRYQSAWKNAPYAPTFVTVDAVVVQSGHILLVERKARPGKGLWALPGGFLDGTETLIQGCLRELREETKLKIPAPVLRGSIKKQHVFDSPYRSTRGRTITHAFHIELEPNTSLPRVKGGDDAKSTRWVPLAELDPAQLFEDHYFIIQYFTGL